MSRRPRPAPSEPHPAVGRSADLGHHPGDAEAAEDHARVDRPRACAPGEVPADEGAADDREGDGPEQGDPGHERGQDQVAAERHQGEADPEPEPASLGLRDPPGDDADAGPRKRHPVSLGVRRPGVAGSAARRRPGASVVDDLTDERRRLLGATVGALPGHPESAWQAPQVVGRRSPGPRPT